VERGLPPKKETILKIGLSEMQKTYYKALLQKDIDVINSEQSVSPVESRWSLGRPVNLQMIGFVRGFAQL
jgi:SNF2 family DNA or RNA helicase